MYGRGVAVSKSDFATYALCAARAEGERREARAAPSSCTSPTTRKSGGNIGPAWLLAQGISRPDFAISAGFSYGITTAHNGCLHLEVEIVGKSAHAARPDTGIDALEAATGVLADLYAIRKTLRGEEIEGRRHRQRDAHRRVDRRRHQHQRRAGQGHVPRRPAHHSRGRSGRGRSDAHRGRSAQRPRSGRASPATSAGSCLPFRSCRSRARRSWSRRSRATRRRSWART